MNFKPTMRADQGSRAAYLLTLLGVVVYLTMSPALLTALGIPYEMSYGSFVFKLHPGTYLLSLALMLALIQEGNPLTALVRRMRDMPLLSVYLLSVVLIFGYSILRYGPSGAAFFIDTLMAPVVIVLIMSRFDEMQLRTCHRLILSLVILNGVIGMIELTFKHHLVPYLVAGVLVGEDEFRATALLGHPLEDALVTSIVLFASLDLRMSTIWRLALCGFFMLALLAFGGRTSFVLSVLILLIYGSAVTLRGLLAGCYGYLQIVGSLVVGLLAVPAIIAVVGATGLGARIFDKLYIDDSASVRFRIFDVFDYLDTYGVLFGISPADIQAISGRMGLDPHFNAIENFWLYMLLQLGVFGFAVFTIGLLCGLLFLYRRVGVGGRWALLIFLITASTSNSLASKTSLLTILFAVLFSSAGFGAVTSIQSANARRGTGA